LRRLRTLWISRLEDDAVRYTLIVIDIDGALAFSRRLDHVATEAFGSDYDHATLITIDVLD